MNTNQQPVYLAPDEFLDKETAAALLGVCTRTLEIWAKAGKLRVSKPTKQTWRVARSEISKMMDRCASTHE
jgi:hypothetical protein